MKWRKPETRREKREHIQEEKNAPSRAMDALLVEQERFILWCEEAEKVILSSPNKPSAQEKASQLLLAAQHKHECPAKTGAEAGPENGWKTQDPGENWRRAGFAGYLYVRGCFPGLLEALELSKARQTTDVAPLIAYLEASPRFFGSGYLAETCIGYVRRAQLTAAHKASLQNAVLKAVNNHEQSRIKDYGRLARAVNSPALRSLLQTLLSGEDPVVRRRAEVVLFSLTDKDAGR